MGLYVRLNLQPDQIDAERWEAVWLTSLQLLEHFPGPLAAHVVDEQHQSRYVLTPHIQFQMGTKEEHWKVNGDLGSGRMGESYCLYRHLAQYRRSAKRATRDEKATDILWLPGTELEFGQVAGASIFDAKSQGFPFHYAMLAVAILVENSFPGQALAHGDISRTQAEQIVPWAEAILKRPLRLPVVTEGARLWQRLVQAYTNEPDLAVRRFLMLCSEQANSAWRVLLQLEDGPDADVLRRVYQSELEQYKSLRQRGAEELVAALCEADDGVDRLLDWVCDYSSNDQPRRFAPQELLECLCDLLVPISPEEREVLDALTPPPDQLATIDTVFFEVFSSLMGKPVACSLYMEEETIAAEFATRWPEQGGRLRELLTERTAKTRDKLDETRAQLDKRMATMDVAENDEDAGQSSPRPEGMDYQPAGEFLYAEIERQRRKPVGLREFASGLGEQMREGLAKNHGFRRDLDASNREELIRQISLGSRTNGFALRESSWEILDRATTEELRHLTMLALTRVPESRFCEARLQLLETPDLWPVLAGTE